jgi:glycosyltransferase involved in cell wall biosynthesis
LWQEKGKMSKELTVVIPCFNHGEYLHDALESILESDPQGVCEIIVVNDGSTDDYTLKILSEINNESIRIINKENGGLASARNRGIDEAQCEYILMLDSDNKIKPDFILSFLELRAEGRQFDMLHGDALYFGQKTGVFKSAPLNIFRIFQGNYIDACTIIKKESLIELGKYDGQMPYMGWEDWDLWIRMALLNKQTIYIEKIFFEYRYLETSMIRTIGHKENETKQFLINKYKNHLIDDIFLSNVLNDLITLNIEKMGIRELLKILHGKIRYKLLKKGNLKHRIFKLWI